MAGENGISGNIFDNSNEKLYWTQHLPFNINFAWMPNFINQTSAISANLMNKDYSLESSELSAALSSVNKCAFLNTKFETVSKINICTFDAVKYDSNNYYRWTEGKIQKCVYFNVPKNQPDGYGLEEDWSDASGDIINDEKNVYSYVTALDLNTNVFTSELINDFKKQWINKLSYGFYKMNNMYKTLAKQINITGSVWTNKEVIAYLHALSILSDENVARTIFESTSTNNKSAFESNNLSSFLSYGDKIHYTVDNNYSNLSARYFDIASENPYIKENLQTIIFNND